MLRDDGGIRHTSPAGQDGPPSRFDLRWRLVGGGLSNVWRFGDLELTASSGRLLLRGPNGTGKTTALEALAPYLLDLNAARMSAGKSRTTNLSSLMREGATGKRRYGYVWLSLAGPGEGIWSFGVRIQYSEGSSPAAKVTPFVIQGRPLHELRLHQSGRLPLKPEEFAGAVVACGGQVFEDDDAYVAHLAVRLFGTPDREDVATLAARLRHVRNPTLLGDVSPKDAADALRESLPRVAETVIIATADALAESDATREAFARDKEAAALLEEFRAAWCGHLTEVVSATHRGAADAAHDARHRRAKLKSLGNDFKDAKQIALDAEDDAKKVEIAIAEVSSEIHALEEHEAYQDAGRLAELKESAHAKGEAADTSLRLMENTAQTIVTEQASVQRELGQILEDLNECREQARTGDPKARVGAPTFNWKLKPRAPLRAGTIVVDVGAELVILGDGTNLREAASAWLRLAETHAAQSDAAALAISDYKDVAALELEEKGKVDEAARLTKAAEGESNTLSIAETSTRAAASALLATVRAWTSGHSQLSDIDPPLEPELAGSDHDGWTWDVEAVDDLASTEPNQVLVACDRWATHALIRAERLASELRARAQWSTDHATTLRAKASALREEATALRAGRLLPFPRPEWSGPGDDDVALGAALDWDASAVDQNARALVEAAMGAAGILGATVASDGAATRHWRVEATGPVAPTNVGELVAVDPASPFASIASAVLSRIRLVPSAGSLADEEGASALCIGRDGTFAMGVLRGRVPGADNPTNPPAASHIGARQRRAAALTRALVLEAEADELETEATREAGVAARLRLEATALSAAGHDFPSRDDLRRRETHRVEVATRARELQEIAIAARDEAERRGRETLRAHAAWSERTRSRGLPADIEALSRMRDTGKAAASELRKAAGPLESKLPERLDGVLARYSGTDIAQTLEAAEGKAQAAVRVADDANTQVRVLEETAGSAITEVLERHKKAVERLGEWEQKREPARKRETEAVGRLATIEANQAAAQRDLEATEQAAEQRLSALRDLLEVPGVARSMLDEEAPASDERLLAQIEETLKDRKRTVKKVVRERADTVRAKLAGIWAIDPGDDHGELLTYVVTHRDTTYTPTEAAVHAERLKKRAEAALAVSEERALSEFVIGQLPGAIGTAWIRLRDWVDEVNRKMRSAAASSGVAVQVRTPLRNDLTPASQTVHELSCKVSGAERSTDQQAQLGEALRALLSAAPGDTMAERVAAAVDIRDWVEVHYEVTRPGGKSQRWNSRTGLSGGERRLVVLAPMLAAIAAAYDRFGSRALRLATLDEVPAEVDERGREGLARYIAELDLDLICTSFQWDGCPGAWDGIDAYDLEAAPDGTVVAFPMLVRGLQPIPEVTTTTPELSSPPGAE